MPEGWTGDAVDLGALAGTEAGRTAALRLAREAGGSAPGRARGRAGVGATYSGIALLGVLGAAPRGGVTALGEEWVVLHVGVADDGGALTWYRAWIGEGENARVAARLHRGMRVYLEGALSLRPSTERADHPRLEVRVRVLRVRD